MNVKSVYKLSGYLSIVIGLLAFLCIFRAQYRYYSVALSILGLTLAIVNIFLNEKYYNEQEKYPKGYVGMLLSSLPVIFFMLLIFKVKF